MKLIIDAPDISFPDDDIWSNEDIKHILFDYSIDNLWDGIESTKKSFNEMPNKSTAMALVRQLQIFYFLQDLREHSVVTIL